MQNASPPRKIIWVVIAIIILAVAVSGTVALGYYGPRTPNTSGNATNGANGSGTGAQLMTMSQAVQIFENYLTSLQNSNIALHEVEQYQYNFYASYYEKDTGTFAFQMLIWRSGSSPMMGTMGYSGVTGTAVPEMGPNMMWNTKYSVMNGMMGSYGGGMMGGLGRGSGPMTITGDQAKTLGQQYLNGNMPGKTAGDADTFYGYYNVDVLLDGSPSGMLSVNGYTGQVWYHSWHGTYLQTVTIS